MVIQLHTHDFDNYFCKKISIVRSDGVHGLHRSDFFELCIEYVFPLLVYDRRLDTLVKYGTVLRHRYEEMKPWKRPHFGFGLAKDNANASVKNLLIHSL